MPRGGGQVTLEERRAKYEWEGAPRGVCEICGKFYEENSEHEGKDNRSPVEKHRFRRAEQ